MSGEPLPAALRFPSRLIPAKARVDCRPVLPDYLPARMLNEYVYCPRLFFYEWVEGVFAHNSDTVEGALRHEKLGTAVDAMPSPNESADRIHSRSVTLTSDAVGLIATIDLVESDGDSVSPVDYKRGRPRETDDGLTAWPADRAQVCAQALILRENGYRCNEAVVYYNETKQRVRVAIDDALVGDIEGAIRRARELAGSGLIPPPLVDSPKCPRCSLVGICLPDETRAAFAWRDDDGGPFQLSLFAEIGSNSIRDSSEEEDPVRRLVPARDDLRPLYVTGFNFTVGKSNDVLQVREKRDLVQEVRLRDISNVSVFGNVTVTAGAVQALCEAERPIAYFSIGGWFYGLTQGLGLKNVFLRQEQFRGADDEAFCLRLAREFVASKIRNQRTLLQRNHIEPPARAIDALRRLRNQANEAGSLETLLGIEGAAAHYYFANFSGMLKAEDESENPTFDFARRNRRPPRDPVNALLSLGYSLLARDLTITCHVVGFDPFIGFYHQPRFGRPALALDLMEGFRPLIVDSAVITAINTRMVTREDFIQVGPSVALTAKGRKRFITAYEQRMDALVTHPLFGYRVNYRRVLEIQTRLLARVVSGEIVRFPGFETR